MIELLWLASVSLQGMHTPVSPDPSSWRSLFGFSLSIRTFVESTNNEIGSEDSVSVVRDAALYDDSDWAEITLAWISLSHVYYRAPAAA